MHPTSLVAARDGGDGGCSAGSARSADAGSDDGCGSDGGCSSSGGVNGCGNGSGNSVLTRILSPDSIGSGDDRGIVASSSFVRRLRPPLGGRLVPPSRWALCFVLWRMRALSAAAFVRNALCFADKIVVFHNLLFLFLNNEH